ncbi:MAG: hypothetical protein WC655_15640 [Candidatus Hydrogenedentales bacterium]
MSLMSPLRRGAVAALLMAVAAAYAQDPPAAPKVAQPPAEAKQGEAAPPPDWNDRDVRELVNAVLMARISRELDLTDEQTVIMMRRFGEHKDGYEKCAADRARAFKELKVAIGSNATDEDVQKKLNALVELDKKLAELRQDAFKSIAAGMTARQQAQMYTFIMDFENQMKRLVQRAKELGNERLIRLRDEVDGPMGPGADRRSGDRLRRLRGEIANGNPAVPAGPKDAPPPPPPPPPATEKK